MNIFLSLLHIISNMNMQVHVNLLDTLNFLTSLVLLELFAQTSLIFFLYFNEFYLCKQEYTYFYSWKCNNNEEKINQSFALLRSLNILYIHGTQCIIMIKYFGEGFGISPAFFA